MVEHALTDHFGHPHGICRHPDPSEPELLRSMTIASSLVDLTSGEYRVSTGNPCEGGFHTLPWNVYDGSVDTADGPAAVVVARRHDDGCFCGG
jgi:isopenicillin-N N-acyltransferase-like protein